MPSTVAAFTAREVAELSGAPKRLVEKAIEQRILPTRHGVRRRHGKSSRRLLPLYAVGYATLLTKLDLKLGLAQKKRLAARLATIEPKAVHATRIELAPAVELDLGRLVGDAMERAERYRVDRDAWIINDEGIMGGTPVIRGTRMTVYSVLGRIEHGDALDEIAAENPDVPRDALMSALTYARAHPFVGRPGGRPWERAA